MVVRVYERALDGVEDSGVSSLLPRGVIAASVTALGLDVRDGEVLFDQSLVELRQLAIGVVCDNPDFFSSTLLDLGGHVELAHRDDLDTIDTTGLVVIGDGLGTQEASLLKAFASTARSNTTVEGTDFDGVPVELDSAVRLKVGFQQSHIGFQDGDSAATIVVGTSQGHRSEARRRGRTNAGRRLSGAARNGHMLVLVGRVSIIKV